MIRSKGRGGARKGAGRPPFTKARTKVSYFSTRITQKTRDLLEQRLGSKVNYWPSWRSNFY